MRGGNNKNKINPKNKQHIPIPVIILNFFFFLFKSSISIPNIESVYTSFITVSLTYFDYDTILDDGSIDYFIDSFNGFEIL